MHGKNIQRLERHRVVAAQHILISKKIGEVCCQGIFDPLICLRRGVELLEPNGTLLITVPAFPCLWTSHDELNHHFKRYTKTTLTEVTRRAGIEVLSCRYFFQWTFPVKLMVRLKEGFLDASVRPPKIPPHWVNDTLYRVSKVEQKVFGLLPVPFGSSLILVGGKV